MIWTFEFTQKAAKEFTKLDIAVQKKIKSYWEKNVLNTQNPRKFGKRLSHNYKDYWRFRVEDYCIICVIHDQDFLITSVHVGHRKNVYDVS